jgi:hypothetical protein
VRERERERERERDGRSELGKLAPTTSIQAYLDKQVGVRTRVFMLLLSSKAFGP